MPWGPFLPPSRWEECEEWESSPGTLGSFWGSHRDRAVLLPQTQQQGRRSLDVPREDEGTWAQFWHPKPETLWQPCRATCSVAPALTAVRFLWEAGTPPYLWPPRYTRAAEEMSMGALWPCTGAVAWEKSWEEHVGV